MPKRRRRTNRSRQRSLPGPYIASLDFQWMHLMASGLSKATHLSYSSGQRCFIGFCLQFGLLITLPASIITISRFISYLSLSYQPSTVKSYLSAVRSLHVIMGLDSPSANHPRVQLVLRGTKRLQGNNRRLRRPTTPELLLFFFVINWTFQVMGTVCTVCSLTWSDCS